VMRLLGGRFVRLLLLATVAFHFGDFLAEVLFHSDHIWVIRPEELDVVQIAQAGPHHFH
jgi:hypothetical protein